MKREEFIELKWRKFCDDYFAKPYPAKISLYYKIAQCFFSAGFVYAKTYKDEEHY